MACCWMISCWMTHASACCGSTSPGSLDRSLVLALPRSGRARQQVRNMQRRGLTMTAEGVSSPALFRMLRFLGVKRAQGLPDGPPPAGGGAAGLE